jgi:Xaa-Pro aminopeptidase
MHTYGDLKEAFVHQRFRSLDLTGFGPNKAHAIGSWQPTTEAPFTSTEYAQRVERARAAMAAEGVDCLFLTAPESICYLTGFAAEWYQANGPAAWAPASGVALHVDHAEPVFFETYEEATLVALTVVTNDVRLFDAEGPEMQQMIADELAAAGWLGSTVGLEMRSYRPHRAASETFERMLVSKGAEVIDATDILRRLRRYKSDQELAYARTAQEIADIGMAAAREVLAPGVTELEVYGAMVHAMARAGGEVSAIPLPVLSGPHAATIHALASRRVIEPGDIVNVDISGVFNRYHANMARCFSIGEPRPEVRRRIAEVLATVDVVAEVLRPGVAVDDLLAAVHGYLSETGLLGEEWWVGGYELGVAFPPDWVGDFSYSLGEWHAGEVFGPGEVCNFEANFYLPQDAGLAVSINTFVVTREAGEFLQSTPSELVVIE